MDVLLRYFWDLLRLRRGPQDVPASPVLLGLLLVLSLLLNTLLGGVVLGGWWRALAAEVLELVVSAGLLFAALQVRGHAGRWLQSYTALLGSGVLLGVIAMGYRLLATLLGLGPLVDVLDLLLFFWGLLVLGHILRHALEIPLPFGILLAFVYTMFLFGLVAQWVLPEAALQPVD